MGTLLLRAHAHFSLPALCVQAVCFLESGRAFVPAKPWRRGQESCWVASAAHLSPAAREYLDKFRQQQQQQQGAEEGRGK